MSGIDLLLAKSLSSKIKRNLDSKTEEKINLRLFKKFGLSIKQSIEDFEKLDEILKEFLKSDSRKFEQDCLSEIIEFDDLKKDSLELVIKDKAIVEQFLEILGDKESRKIIEQTLKKPLLISEILDICKLSQTSGYRKINSLIRNGFLIKSGHELTTKKRVIYKYSMFCKKINIELEKEKYIVKVKISRDIFRDSSIIQTIRD